jgi:hypothetical protein
MQNYEQGVQAYADYINLNQTDWDGDAATPSKWSTLTPTDILADVNALLAREFNKPDAEWFPLTEPTVWIPYSTYFALKMHRLVLSKLLHKLLTHRAKRHYCRPKKFTTRRMV